MCLPIHSLLVTSKTDGNMVSGVIFLICGNPMQVIRHKNLLGKNIHQTRQGYGHLQNWNSKIIYPVLLVQNYDKSYVQVLHLTQRGGNHFDELLVWKHTVGGCQCEAHATQHT